MPDPFFTVRADERELVERPAIISQLQKVKLRQGFDFPEDDAAILKRTCYLTFRNLCQL